MDFKKAKPRSGSSSAKLTIQYVSGFIFDAVRSNPDLNEIKTPLGYLPESDLQELAHDGIYLKIIKQDQTGTLYSISRTNHES